MSDFSPAAAGKLYRLVVYQFPPQSTTWRLGLSFLKPASAPPMGQRLELILGYSPELEQMKQGTRFELKGEVGPLINGLDVALISYELDTTGKPAGTFSSRPFLIDPAAPVEKAPTLAEKSLRFERDLSDLTELLNKHFASKKEKSPVA